VSDDEALRALRAELDRIDHELLGLAHRRLAVVAQIKDHKRATGRHLFDRTREQEVYRRAEAHAQEIGLDPELACALLRQLIEASHRLQETPGDDEATSASRRILIVGGRGKMGTMLGAAFAARGHAIEVIDEGDRVDPSVVSAADVVMVAVPMAHAEEVVALYAPLVREDALLCDINSLKADVCVALAESRGEALGTHPMFGPTVRSLRRQKVVLCDVKPGPMSAWWQAELGRMGAEVIRCSPEHHDAMMSIVQVLTHFGIIAMGRALRATGYPLASSLPYTSPIYRLELAMVGRLFSQKPELYFEIMRGNPQGEAVRATFLREAQALCDALADDDGDAFVQAFLEVRDYFADEAERSMELSDQIIETTMARP